MQRMKHHPHFRAARHAAYGAQALPRRALEPSAASFSGRAASTSFHFPLISHTSPFPRLTTTHDPPSADTDVVTTAKIKGTHNAMQVSLFGFWFLSWRAGEFIRSVWTAMLSAETTFAALSPSGAFVSTASPATFTHPASSAAPLPHPPPPIPPAPTPLPQPLPPDHLPLRLLRRLPLLPCARGRTGRPGFATRLGLAGSMLYARVETMLRGRVPWTLGHHGKRTNTSPDALAMRPVADLSSVALTGTNHAEGEAVYLRVMRGVDGPVLSTVDTQGAKANAVEEKGGVDT
ncbi:hypothetical protein DFH09DRAFT_1364670 [Mycena vulgaris]|nr:hypothetical protein DFH09DRAFT_1364670 [Mycena vulgaris]